MNTINAGRLVLLGEQLVGRAVRTPPMGDYPGGDAWITALHPDPQGAPEIVMQVDLPGWGEIGVFEYELVALLPLEESLPVIFEAARAVLRETEETSK